MGLESVSEFRTGCLLRGGGISTQEALDAVNLAAELKAGLDGGDVGKGKVIVGADQIVGRFEQEADAKGGFFAAVDGSEGVADF